MASAYAANQSNIKMMSSPPSPPKVTRASSNSNNRGDGEGEAQATTRPGAGGGRAFYGMLRKTKKKTYGAIVRGSRGLANNKPRGAMLENHEGMNVDFSSSDSLAGAEGVGISRRSSRGAGVQAPSARSPFTTPHTIAMGGGGVGVEPARSFYFSPQNSWENAAGGAGAFGASYPQQQNEQQSTDEDPIKSSVHIVECIVRQIVICSAMFIAGTMMSEHASKAQHVLELSLVAWGTCLLIVILGWIQSYRFQLKRTRQHHQEQQRAIAATQSLSTTPMASNLATGHGAPIELPRNERPTSVTIPETELSSIQTDLSKKRSHDEVNEPSFEDIDKPPSSKVMRGEKYLPSGAVQTVQPRQQHPQLENIYVMMVGENERIFPNSFAFDLDNELFSGKMLLMFRTSDVDENLHSDDPVVNYFRGKQRRFEFQWQFKLKKVPEGDVFMNMELDEPIKMGMIQRALANTVLKFVKKMNQGFTYSLSDTLEMGPSYLSFPLGTSMDRFHATKPGETPPMLGKEVFEDSEQMKMRKKGKAIEWSTENTYTMSLWSAYFDWIEWKILNFPGIRPFSATGLAGVQPIKMNLLTDCESSEKNPKRNVLVSMEVSNSVESVLGTEAKKWIAKTAKTSEMQCDAIIEDINNVTEMGEEIDSVPGNEKYEEDDDDEEMDEQSDIEDLEEDDEGVDVMSDVLDTIETDSYLLSGGSVRLREGSGNYVASGGGYAVLQSSPSSSIVMEKFQPKKKKGNTSGPSLIIRNGDAVRVKLVEGKSIKWLSLHRGWWMRWSNTRPKRNGLFYIRTDEPSGSLVVLGCPFSLVSRRWSHYLIGACIESSLKYGGRMLGIYKTGKGLLDDEPVYGDDDDVPTHENDMVDEKIGDKRMMPLLLCAEPYQSTDGNLSSPLKSPTRMPKLKREFSSEDIPSIPALESAGQIDITDKPAQKRYEIDVPIWLEVMNRTQRTKQLVYAVRVKETTLKQANAESAVDNDEPSDSQNNQSNTTTCRTFVKLRTGHDLAPILSMGVDYKPELSPASDQWQQRFDFPNQDELNDADSFSSGSSSDDSDSEEEHDEEPSHFLIAGPNHSGVNDTFTSDQGDEFAQVFPDDDPEKEVKDIELHTPPTQQDFPPKTVKMGTDDNEKKYSKGKRRSSSKLPLKREKSVDSDRAEESNRSESFASTGESRRRSIGRVNSEEDMLVHSETKKKHRAKHSALIGRVAKTVKSSTVVTGKHVIKHSKNIGKGTVKGTVNALQGTVNAGRALNNKPPRRHEPGGRVSRKRTDKGQKVIGRAIKNIEGQGNFSTSLLSGQLQAPDQSCCKVSEILWNMSNTQNNPKPIMDAISSLVMTNSTQDSAFLRGSSAELGVKPLEPVDPKSDLDCVVGRCIYDGRWREELCVMYTKGNHLSFYEPLSKKPSLVVSFDEILSARKCEQTEDYPLPGFHCLSIDTGMKCQYLVFLEQSERDTFLAKLNDALYHSNEEGQRPISRKVAPEYERYRLSLESSLTGSVGKWHRIQVSKKSKQQKKQRRILNGRRMAFDLVSVTGKETTSKSEAQDKSAKYVENLLRMALSFSPDALDANDSRFIQFLDETSRLRTLPLHDFDLSSTDALCIFVNLYHCLLQHSLLLSIDGLPTKRSVTHFKRCSCYEIGGDVFSLAELESCVIRGKTSRPSSLKPPFVIAHKKSRPYQLMYGLSATDHRINFLLNNGDLAYPSAVPVLESNQYEDQIDVVASRFLTNQVKIDKKKRTVYLPKVCDVYRNDFGMGDGLVCLSQCLIYLDESDQQAIADLLDEGVVSVKFRRHCEDFHSNLTELQC